MISAIIALLCLGGWLYVLGYNGWNLWSARRGRDTGSPILLAGPLLAAMGAGFLMKAFPGLPGWLPWGLIGFALVIDPAALPLIGKALLRPRD